MYIPKRYGQSKIESCPFCQKQAVAHNSQGIPVCSQHRDEKLQDIKCACGSWLELKIGKWGPYFQCIRCGNINFKKAMEMNAPSKATTPSQDKLDIKKNAKNETVVRSDELDFF
jgi:hypothetical protein